MSVILFEEDWYKWEGAEPDWDTTNQSFVRLAGVYKKMGVKNHAFHLALLDQSLKGVDPFDPNLTRLQMLAISRECKLNFWYFLREIARAPGKAGGKDKPFRATRGNISVFWLFFNHVTPIHIQPRQTGKSFGSNILTAYLMNIRCTGTEINLLTKDEKLRSETIDRIKEIEHTMPFYLQQRTKTDRTNSEELTINFFGNKYRTHLPNPSEKLALNVGRGLSSPVFFIDEIAFLFHIAISLPAALAGGTALRETARENNEPYGSVFTTTAGKIDDRDGRYAYALVQGSAPWTETYYDCRDEVVLHDVITKASRSEDLMVNCTFNHRQLGYTDEWLRRAIKDSNKGTDIDEEAIKRDFLNIWTNGSRAHPLSPALIERIRLSMKDDFTTTIDPKYGYITRWFVNDIRQAMSKKTVLGLDSSNAGGRDDTAFVIRDVESGSVIAACNVNETNLVKYSEWLLSLFILYPEMTGIIENRSSGTYILDYLIRGMLSRGLVPHKRLFNNVVDECTTNELREHPLLNTGFGINLEDLYAKYKRHFGFTTAGSGKFSRDELYSTTLTASAKVCGDSVNDPTTIDQLLTLENRNGRIDHPVGGHDDNVIAFMLSYWFISMGKNLQHYGIQARTVLRLASYHDSEESVDDARRQHEVYLEDQIVRLTELMRNTKDTFVSLQIESRLRLLVDEYNVSAGDTVLSADAFIVGLNKGKSSYLDRRNAYRY